MTINTQNQSDIASRLRCKYPVGPIGDNGEPEFGWRDFSGPAPEGMVLPTQIMLDAADTIDAQTAEIAEARSQIEHLDRQNNALRDALDSIRQYGNDTLSGRADGGPDDRKWQRDAVIEMRNRARAALSGESNG